MSFSCITAELAGTKFSKTNAWICCPTIAKSGNIDNIAYDTVINGTTANNVVYVNAAALFNRPCAPNCATIWLDNQRNSAIDVGEHRRCR